MASKVSTIEAWRANEHHRSVASEDEHHRSVTSEYVRNQPDFFAVGPASTPAAIDEVGEGIWCSPGMSSRYLITTGAGRIVVNTGMWFEARPTSATTSGLDAPTRYIILTQSHTDHIGGVDSLRE